MKKIIILISILFAWFASLSAQITHEQANAIVLDYTKSVAPEFIALYANLKTPDEAGITIKTSNEETFRAKYACWTYCLDETIQRRYLFVKKENGNLLEVIASNDISELDVSWEEMDTNMTNLENIKDNNLKQFYPNAVGGLLTLPCEENTFIEIYDLKGTCFFSRLLSGDDNCQLNLSFLSAGIYILNISGKTYKIIKK